MTRSDIYKAFQKGQKWQKANSRNDTKKVSSILDLKDSVTLKRVLYTSSVYLKHVHTCPPIVIFVSINIWSTVKDVCMIYRALWDRGHDGASMISQSAECKDISEWPHISWQKYDNNIHGHCHKVSRNFASEFMHTIVISLWRKVSKVLFSINRVLLVTGIVTYWYWFLLKQTVLVDFMLVMCNRKDLYYHVVRTRWFLSVANMGKLLSPANANGFRATIIHRLYDFNGLHIYRIWKDGIEHYTVLSAHHDEC